MGTYWWTEFIGLGEHEWGMMDGLGGSQGSRNARKTRPFPRLNSFEFIGRSDLESGGSIMRYLGWPGENSPWPIT
jgi:hypothetical protein